MKNIIAIILIVVSIGVYFVYIHPIWSGVTGSADWTKKSITELKADELNYAEAIDKTNQIEGVHNSLLTQYNSISEENRTRIEKLIPDHIDSVRLVIEIMNIAEERGLRVVDISIDANGKGSTGGSGASAPQTPAQAGVGTISLGPQRKNYTAASFGFVVSGTYSNFIEFLQDLEQSLRIVDPTTISFDAKDNGTYDFTIKFHTYLLK